MKQISIREQDVVYQAGTGYLKTADLVSVGS